MLNKLIIILLPVLFCACPYGYKYNTGTIPDSPVNMESINSEFDDYNISAPFILDDFPLVFSSNRNSEGTQMDFIYKLMALDFSKETGELSFYNQTNNNLSVTINHNKIPFLINQINTGSNEFGPYIKSFQYDFAMQFTQYNQEDYSEIKDDFLILYANDESGNLDIKYIHNRTEDSNIGDLTSINSPKNEAYPSFNEDYSRLYFCSDYVEDYSIYSVNWDNEKSIEESLMDETPNPWVEEVALNSEMNDKCPYIDQNIIVFASDRPGGYGGFDLYFSKYVNGSWSTPENFGSQINTEYDEYRPIIRIDKGFTNDLLMFSSDRPGGKGGFDLYYVGYEFN